MSVYIAGLEAAAEAQQVQKRAQTEAQKRAEAQVARERLTPLQTRLARLLATIPVEVQREGLSLSALQASLRGRRRGNCHPGELGAALRKLGFVRRRNWRSGSGFTALWFPAKI